MLDLVLQVIGVLGFVLACLALGWQVWKYQSDRKERIGAKLTVGARIGFAEPTIFLYVWNFGRSSVYIREVVLEMNDEKGELGKGLYGLLLQPHPPCEDRLHPGQGREYLLPVVPALIERASALEDDKVWLAVRSPKGEVLRLPGQEISVYLKALAEKS